MKKQLMMFALASVVAGNCHAMLRASRVVRSAAATSRADFTQRFKKENSLAYLALQAAKRVGSSNMTLSDRVLSFNMYRADEFATGSRWVSITFEKPNAPAVEIEKSTFGYQMAAKLLKMRENHVSNSIRECSCVGEVQAVEKLFAERPFIYQSYAVAELPWGQRWELHTSTIPQEVLKKIEIEHEQVSASTYAKGPLTRLLINNYFAKTYGWGYGNRNSGIEWHANTLVRPLDSHVASMKLHLQGLLVSKFLQIKDLADRNDLRYTLQASQLLYPHEAADILIALEPTVSVSPKDQKEFILDDCTRAVLGDNHIDIYATVLKADLATQNAQKAA